MNLLNRDVHELLIKARNAGCEDEARVLIDKHLFDMYAPSLRRRVEAFIRDHEQERHPVGVIHQVADVKPRTAVLQAHSAWGCEKE